MIWFAIALVWTLIGLTCGIAAIKLDEIANKERYSTRIYILFLIIYTLIGPFTIAVLWILMGDYRKMQRDNELGR